MYYILLTDGKVSQSIPENDPMFPGVSIEQRFSPELLAACVTSETEVPGGWIYDAETGGFAEPPPPEIIEPPIAPEPQDPDVISSDEALAIIMGVE